MTPEGARIVDADGNAGRARGRGGHLGRGGRREGRLRRPSCSRRSTSSPTPSPRRSPTACRAGRRGGPLRARHLDDDFLNDIERIVIVACGTSYHAGLVGRYAIEQWARIPVEMDIASEYRYRDPVMGPNDLVIGITQSGRDGRHAGGHAARAGARREGDGAHQHHGEPGDPRRRHRPLHPRRPRDGRRGDEDLHRPVGGDVPARHLARAVSRCLAPGEDRRGDRRAQGASRRRSDTIASVDERVRAIARAQPTSGSSSTSGATSGCRCASRAR